MQRFTRCYQRLDETTRTSRKVAALVDYFTSINPRDGAWGVFFLTGRKLKRLVNTTQLRTWGSALADLPDWLFEECYATAGDLAETIALLLPQRESSSDRPLHDWVENVIQPLANMTDDQKQATLRSAWTQLDGDERFVFNKLVTGGFRVGVSQKLVVKALAEVAGLQDTTIAQRLMGHWEPTPSFYEQLLSLDETLADITRPYPFCLANQLADRVESLGDVRDWIVEWKWDGIRAQIVRRQGQSVLWSRGEETLLERFPELHDWIASLPDGTVLDGEILARRGDEILPFSELQRRIGRKAVGKKLLADVPVLYVAFDLLEIQGIDLRSSPLSERREKLDHLLASLNPARERQRTFVRELFPPDPEDEIADRRLSISSALAPSTWEECRQLREQSREARAEGLMLKHRESKYEVGRVRGAWWKWKIDPFTIDAVLIYAQSGHGRRANLFTDYTFAVWEGDRLVPFAKAYSGLTDDELQAVDKFVRENTVDKFGPVRSVRPELVFELAFEKIQLSSRHKSGIAVRFPRILRQRMDKLPRDADSLESIRALIAPQES